MNPAIPSVFDAQALTALKSGLRKDDPQALRAAAQQFEALFLQMVMKSMRAAAPQDGPFDSDQTRFYQELLDAQLAQVMASKGGTGLAALIERQLAPVAGGAVSEEGLPLTPPQTPLPFGSGRAYPLPGTERAAPGFPLSGSPVRPAAPASAKGAVPPAPTFRSESAPGGTFPFPPAPSFRSDSAPGGTFPFPPAPSFRSDSAPGGTSSFSTEQSSFVANVWPHAIEAGRASGIPPQFIVAHAALESGWGKSEPRFADGRPSYNLFGLKAGSGWTGATIEAATTEYVNGVAERRIERFRAYASYAEAFADYAQLLAGTPRYARLLGNTDAAGFAQGLQRAGYATDPDYAGKLLRVLRAFG